MPTYIADGLQWLEGQIAPPQPDEHDSEGEQADGAVEVIEGIPPKILHECQKNLSYLIK